MYIILFYVQRRFKIWKKFTTIHATKKSSLAQAVRYKLLYKHNIQAIEYCSDSMILKYIDVDKNINILIKDKKAIFKNGCYFLLDWARS